jgi:hypothetical protein
MATIRTKITLEALIQRHRWADVQPPLAFPAIAKLLPA